MIKVRLKTKTQTGHKAKGGPS